MLIRCTSASISKAAAGSEDVAEYFSKNLRTLFGLVNKEPQHNQIKSSPHPLLSEYVHIARWLFFFYLAVFNHYSYAA